MIRFEGVAKRFPGAAAPALYPVDLEVPDGTVVGLVGRNGAGKSTLLRLAAGICRPTSGRITIDGHDLATDPAAARASLGWVPEVPRFEGTETPFGLLVHLGLLDGLGAPAARRLAEEGIRRVELGPKRAAAIRTLSQGQLRRLSLAAAWLASPSRLLYDEVTNGLDLEGRRLLDASFRELRERGGTAILASHRIEEVEAWCDRVVVMRAGRIVATLPTGAAAPPVPRRMRIVLEPPGPARLEELRSMGRLTVSAGAVTLELEGTPGVDPVAQLVERGFRVREFTAIREDVARWLGAEEA